MQTNLRNNPYVATFWERTKWARYAFLGGLGCGLLLGWLFHGVISFFVQLGVVALLLIPVALIGYAWWRSQRRRATNAGPPPGMTVVTWSPQDYPPRQTTAREE